MQLPDINPDLLRMLLYASANIFELSWYLSIMSAACIDLLTGTDIFYTPILFPYKSLSVSLSKRLTRWELSAAIPLTYGV